MGLRMGLKSTAKHSGLADLRQPQRDDRPVLFLRRIMEKTGGSRRGIMQTHDRNKQAIARFRAEHDDLAPAAAGWGSRRRTRR